MNKSRIVVVALAIALSAERAPNAEDRSTKAEAVGPTIAPVLRFRVGESIQLSAFLENTSQETIYYLMGNQGEGPDLGWFLTKDGRFMPPTLERKPPFADKSRVRALKPGGRVSASLDVSLFYHPGPGPGIYQLVTRYHIGPKAWMVTELGVTPMSFERTIAYLEVFGDEAKGGQ